MNWFFTQARCADATPAAPLGTPPGSAVSAAVPPKKTDFMELPLPVKYEELQREIMMSLKADHFEGGRFDFNKQLNQKFFLSHSVHMGALEVPAQGNQIIKIPNATYEFGANVVDTNYMLVGRVLTDGRVSGRLKYDFTDALSAKLQTSKEPGFSQVMVDLDYKGLDSQAQLKLGIIDRQQYHARGCAKGTTQRPALGRADGNVLQIRFRRSQAPGYGACQVKCGVHAPSQG